MYYYVSTYFKRIFPICNYLLEPSMLDGFENGTFLEEYPEVIKHVNTTVQDVQSILESPGEIQSHNDAQHTILDLSTVEFGSDESFKEFCSNTFGINLNRRDGLGEVTKVYQRVCEQYESRYLRPLPESLQNIQFGSVKKIREFLSQTGKGRLGVYKCELAKLFLSYAKTTKELRFSHIKEIHKEIKNSVFLPVSIHKEENISGSAIVDSRFEGQSGNVNFIGFNRYKTFDSIVGKEVANIGYNTLDNYKDLHGFTFECDTKEDILSLLQQYFYSDLLFESVIENKDLFSEQDIKESKVLDEKTKARLLVELSKTKKTTKDKRTQKGTSDRYREIKIKGYTYFTNPKNPGSQKNKTGVELKFQLKDSENEYGDSFHPVLDYKKRLRELSRLSGMVRQRDIINFVNDFFAHLDRNLSLKGKQREQYLEELWTDLKVKNLLDNNVESSADIESDLSLGLYKLFRKDLVAVKRSTRSQKVYFVHRDYIKQENAGIKKKLEIL